MSATLGGPRWADLIPIPNLGLTTSLTDTNSHVSTLNASVSAKYRWSQALASTCAVRIRADADLPVIETGQLSFRCGHNDIDAFRSEKTCLRFY